jgi:hypothetical protein
MGGNINGSLGLGSKNSKDNSGNSEDSARTDDKTEHPDG